MIRATIVSKSWEQYRELYVWCRDADIPIVQCEVHVGTTLEPMAVSYKGSRHMLSILDDKIGEVERDTAKWQRRGRKSSTTLLLITSGVLLRESDYALVAIKHGIVRRSWSWFTRQAIYGDDEDDE